MVFASAVFLALVASSAFGAPSPLHTVQRYSGQVVKDSYLVTFKAGANKAEVINNLGSAVTAEWDVVNGFAGKLDAEALETLRANRDVESIVEDGIVHTFVTQTNAPWGLSRISQDARLSSTSVTALTYAYNYEAAAGSGVDVYVIDTGIRTTHSQFGGRARWGATFGGYASSDGNGHGTHCAGTVAGSQFGVSKAANVIAVKVLSDSGSGSTADVVSGMNYARTSAIASGRPSVVSLSLGGSASTTVDSAVAALISAGVHVVVAAGNSNVDAGSTSPARAPSAITVGASSITDARASFSNYGSVVDIFAPGVSVISSWSTSDSATNSISGTSMATPHVAGLVAYVISTRGNMTPAAMSTYLKNTAVKNALTGLPSGTANNLASNT